MVQFEETAKNLNSKIPQIDLFCLFLSCHIEYRGNLLSKYSIIKNATTLMYE